MHISVMLDEVTRVLQPLPGKRFLDGTAGGGGHTEALLSAGASVFATDADAEAVLRVRSQLNTFVEQGRLRVEQAWLDASAGAASAAGFTPLDGVLADLGLSSFQLDDADRGFSFMRDGPLDMRFDRSHGPSAADWIDQSDVAEIARVLRDYGDVRQSSRIAEAIWDARPIRSTAQLREVVLKASPAQVRSGKIHPATQVFQALRIVINDELRRLQDAIGHFVDVLRPGGRIAFITFHSLEDRIVKHAFRLLATSVVAEPGFGIQPRSARLVLLSKDPLTPGADEVARNPRARSAKLRVAERLP
jgi:16S rRNA (cytosine1402-N4)-methyltransferase